MATLFFGRLHSAKVHFLQTEIIENETEVGIDETNLSWDRRKPSKWGLKVWALIWENHCFKSIEWRRSRWWRCCCCCWSIAVQIETQAILWAMFIAKCIEKVNKRFPLKANQIGKPPWWWWWLRGQRRNLLFKLS